MEVHSTNEIDRIIICEQPIWMALLIRFEAKKTCSISSHHVTSRVLPMYIVRDTA